MIGLFVTLSVSGCTMPSPEPTPSPTGFASEAEAFAAAEATYRAYIDALNQVDLSDPATFEPVFRLTIGNANAGERQSFSEMHANQWAKTGTTVVTAVQSRSYTPPTTVVIEACVDVSAVDVRDAQGNTLVAADRPPRQAIGVSVRADPDSATGGLISELSGVESQVCD